MLQRKNVVELHGFFDGTPMSIALDKDDYMDFKKRIKEAAKNTIAHLTEEFGSKEKGGEFLYRQTEHYHNKILAISSVVSDEVLERAWGKDWKQIRALWFININAMLQLKRIKNNEMFGWMLIDHNSMVVMKETGAEICVVGKGTSMEKMIKKANKLKETYAK